MRLTEKHFLDVNEHHNGCNINGLENITYEEKKKMALEDANDYLEEYKTVKEAWAAIRNNEECFTEKHGYSDTGHLYLNITVLTAYKDNPKRVYWDVRED